jgi:hypothetical protein
MKFERSKTKEHLAEIVPQHQQKRIEIMNIIFINLSSPGAERGMA